MVSAHCYVPNGIHLICSIGISFAASKVDEILPNLFLGNMDAAKDLELLKSHAITHVVSAAVR